MNTLFNRWAKINQPSLNTGCRNTTYYREACWDTQTSISYSHLVRAPNSRSGGHEFESPVRQELGALTKSGIPWGQVFLQWWPRRDHMIMSRADSFAKQTHLLDATSLNPSAVPTRYLWGQVFLNYKPFSISFWRRRNMCTLYGTSFTRAELTLQKL